MVGEGESPFLKCERKKAESIKCKLKGEYIKFANPLFEKGESPLLKALKINFKYFLLSEMISQFRFIYFI